MTTGKVHEEHKLELEKMLRGKSILLIAAGKSSVNEKDKIINFSMKENVVTISVNYDYSHVKTNFIFVSNLSRVYKQNIGIFWRKMRRLKIMLE